MKAGAQEKRLQGRQVIWQEERKGGAQCQGGQREVVEDKWG